MTQVIHMDNIILGHDDYRMYSLCTLIYVQTEEQSILICFMLSLRFNWISANLAHDFNHTFKRKTFGSFD